MKVFYDWEFLEDGSTIKPISVGMVREDGVGLYLVSGEAPWEDILRHEWLLLNVVTKLPELKFGEVHPGGERVIHMTTEASYVVGLETMRDRVSAFLEEASRLAPVELWADYAAYDHVALAQLWGPMVSLPAHVPMWTHELQQVLERSPGYILPEQPLATQHHALHDAYHSLVTYCQVMGRPVPPLKQVD